MATNLYFTQGRSSEKELYEDLIIESLKIYGQDVYYMPREMVNKDAIFQDDNVSRFDDAYKLEMYIENTEGFDGEGDLFTKFGVEIRDAATFIVSRRRFLSTVSKYEQKQEYGGAFYRPREGDLISLPLSNSIFEITKVEDESPFYQLKDLPVFKIRAELFEYNDEDFDTGVQAIDSVETLHAFQQQVIFTAMSGPDFEVGEIITQDIGNGIVLQAEVMRINFNDPTMKMMWIGHIGGASDGEYHEFNTTSYIVGQTSGAMGMILVHGEYMGFAQDAQNSEFEIVGDQFIDFSESNPFGDP